MAVITPMGEKRIVLSADRLQSVIDFFDRLIGSLEPLRRELLFFWDGGLKLGATDGCLFARLSLPWVDFTPKRATIAVPLDPLKGFIKEVKGDVEIEIGEVFKLRAEKNTLEIRARKKPKMAPWPKGTVLGEVSSAKLRLVLDFSSVHLTDADVVSLVASGGGFYALGYSEGVLGASRWQWGLDSSFQLVIPYASARHLVKCLELIKREKIIVEAVEGFLFFKAGALRLGITGETPGNGPFELLDILFSEHKVPIWAITSKAMKAMFSLAARMERFGAMRTILAFSEEKIKVAVETPHGRFMTYEEVQWAKDSINCEIPLRAEKAWRLISRFSSETVLCYKIPKGMLLTDGKTKAILFESFS